MRAVAAFDPRSEVAGRLRHGPALAVHKIVGVGLDRDLEGRNEASGEQRPSAATMRSANAKPCPASAAVVVRSTRRDGPEGAMAPAPAASSHAGQRAGPARASRHRPEDRRGIESASFSAGEGCTRRRDRRQRFSRPRYCAKLRRRTGCRGQSPPWKNRLISGWVLEDELNAGMLRGEAAEPRDEPMGRECDVGGNF